MANSRIGAAVQSAPITRNIVVQASIRLNQKRNE